MSDLDLYNRLIQISRDINSAYYRHSNGGNGLAADLTAIDQELKEIAESLLPQENEN